ncbi:hypothetical protein DNH61_01145 [Paenibacillus sambharensis]|uniref:HAMP domain-containing protein n=1 Tax=Paenibacillus sambharensis TaxID=1803190 RepID=A0A2W1LRC7_9BACL|nr:sensor histidine kinase [Paenibacillus sambharensis]PZD97512.1 hypothetical protein DNH61_01145 [Paenibacillus sambharensis]
MYRIFSRIRYQASLQTKFLVTSVLLLLIVLGCFIVYVNWLVLPPLKERTEQDMLATAVQVSDRLDSYIESQNQLSQRILAGREIFKLLSAGHQPLHTVEGLALNRKLKDIMFQAAGPSLNIRDMTIFDLSGTLMASFIGYEDSPSTLAPVLRDKERPGEWNQSGYTLVRQPSGVVSFIRAIINQNGDVFGYLAVQLDQSYLQQPAAGVADGEVLVLDQEARIIAASQPDLAARLSHGLMRPAEGSGMYTDGTDNIIAYYKSPGTTWTTYVVKPKQSVLGPVNSVKYMSILLLTSLMIFSFIYIYFSTKNLLLPVRKLRSQILRINYSNMKVKVDSRSPNNELVMLSEAFQELMERLQQSMDREKLALHEEVKARNSALQAQISPHFIHNVLYLISIAAQEGKNDAVTDMCKHLSDSLRYIVSSPYEHVTLTEELQHTSHYLSLVSRHYEEDLEWEMDTDESAGLIMLPRLVIQPFVENCIEHAFSDVDPPWHIRIRVRLYNGIWAIEIFDNGLGFDQEKMKEIMAKVQGFDSDFPAGEKPDDRPGIGNMGIVNTVHRLKLMYRNRLFFNMYNNQDRGATVQIIASLTKDFY